MCYCYDGTWRIATEFFLAEEKSRHYFDDQEGKVDIPSKVDILFQLSNWWLEQWMMSHSFGKRFYFPVLNSE